MIERLLKKAIEQYKQELEDINTNIKNLHASTLPIKADLLTAITELQKVCAHTNTSRVNGMYMSGGFDHVSEQPYTIVCDECGFVLESRLIRGTYA